MKKEPNYYSILPANVRYDERLSMGEKVLYSEISALSNKNGVCWANNTYFATLYKVSTRTITEWISNLVKYGHLVSFQKDEKRMLRISTPLEENCTEARSILPPPLEENFQHNNTSINNTSNNKSNSNWLKTVINIYSSFWKETYGEDKQVFNWGRLGKTLAPLKNLSEQQWRLLIKLHFNWRGASGDDEKAFKYMADKFFPLEWIPHNFDGYKAYVVNHLGLDWNNDEQLKEYNK